MTKNIQWALYARKSEESEDKQVQSIGDQVKYLTDVARREGYKIVEIISEAKSAKEPDNRPEFKRLLSLIEKGQVQGILCWKLDRLSRNPIDSARIQWFLQKGKIKCIKASDRNYLPDDNALLLAVEQGMANQYVRDLAKNVRRGLESKAQKGWYPSIPPIGYLNTKKGQKGLEEILIDPARFHIVRKMWDLMLTGNYSAMEVLRIATTEWKLDTPMRRKNGKKPIASSYIYTMFSNIFYTGNFIYADKFYKGNHTAMVTIDEFDKMQIILGKRGQPRPKIHEFPYTGIMHCSNCRSSITATEKKKILKRKNEIKTYTYYHCTRHVGINDCHKPPITQTNLEAQIETKLIESIISPNFYELGIAILKANAGNQAQGNEEMYERQFQFVNDLQKKIDRLLDFLLNETISEEEYANQKRNLENRLGMEKGKLNQIKLRYTDYDRLIVNAFTFSRASLNALKSKDKEVQRAVFSGLGSNHEINDKILCVERPSWVSVLKNGEKELLPEIERFELERSNGGKPYLPFNQFFPLMCALVDKVRTELMKSPDPPYIPDLSKWIDTTT